MKLIRIMKTSLWHIINGGEKQEREKYEVSYLYVLFNIICIIVHYHMHYVRYYIHFIYKKKYF